MTSARFAVRPLAAQGFAELVAGRVPEARLILADQPLGSPEVLEMLRGLAEGISREFDETAWIALDGDRIVALSTITRHTVPGEPEIGYGTAPGHEGQGAASALVNGVASWASGCASVKALRAETGTANIASQRVLERNGFVRIGERQDPEDGPLYCWRLEKP